ncbi:di-trans,poly-cis-decaprenylcistransferase [Candidatus Legionella polyplacis]|uniref:polyprenyl diphosphate synthase n=1 Tax=Candidatus Legionella polyplacis TaxID=2005262 RepID=UPI000C1E6AFE|nr:polyprenyl diphosphate synthase [Candidatus Legionella polyplacis]ATW02090.1 di-trans,poly-cis-decaprenylcistransferase [Candidatus Legionella polyplacis]
MDGNGRWARNHGLARVDGYKYGINVIKNIIFYSLNHSIPILSLFTFSKENWRRPKEEIESLMQLFISVLDREIDDLNNHNVSLRFLGECKKLPNPLKDRIRKTEYITRDNKKLILNIVVNYSGRWDLFQTVKNITRLVALGKINYKLINKSLVSKFLCTYPLPDPDLFIRTSGEKRISNFFLWQLAYTELYFTDVLWPDFTIKDFEKALKDFSLRNRRYGNI